MNSFKLPFIVSLSMLVPSALGEGKFIFSRCSCTASYAQSYVVNAIKDGAETSITVNTSCDRAEVDTCSSWTLTDNCGDSGYCGIGSVCYNVEVTSSDQFTVNGNTYEKNDYTNNLDNIFGSDTCEALCANVGDQPNSGSDDGASFQITITGWPEPTWC